MQNKIFLTVLLIGLIQFSFAQSKSAQTKKRKYKSFHETSYAKDDILLIDVVYNDSRLDYLGVDSVKLIGDFLVAHPSFIVEIGVFNDVRGNAKYNKSSSEIRAKSVADYLYNEYKIPYDRIKYYGYGEENPVYTQEEINKKTNAEEKEKMYAANRRTEIKILSVK